MKVAIKETEQKQFKPFVLEIAVETMQDLYDLWHRFNLASGTINAESNSVNVPRSYGNDNIVWDFLDDKLEELKNGI